MKNHNEAIGFPRKRTRVRGIHLPVDFMKVEDIGTMPAMNPLELETRSKISEQSRTPADELISDEESRSDRVFRSRANKTLKRLVRKRLLPRRLWLVYELRYTCKLSDEDVAYLMNISRDSIRKFHQLLRRAFVRILEKRESGRAFLKKARSVKLSRKQKGIVHLHFVEGFSPSQIAKMTARSKQGVCEVIRRVRKKIFQA